MSVNSGSSNNCCRTVQQVLTRLAGAQNVPTFRIENPGMLAALTSGINTNGIESVDISDPSSKDRIVKVKYWQNPRDAASSSAPNICSFDTPVLEKWAEVLISNTRSVKLTIKDSDYRVMCEELAGKSSLTQTNLFMEQVKAKLNQMLTYIDRDAATIAYANVGNFSDGTTGPKEVTLTGAINGMYGPQYKGELDMKRQFTLIEAMDRPIVVGDGLWWEYANLQDIVCCNDAGIDPSSVNGNFYYFRDAYVDTAIGTENNAIAFSPGAYQIFFRNYFNAPFDYSDEGKQKGVVTFDYNGYSIPLDFTAYYDFCGDSNNGRDSKWVFTWTASFGMFYMPDDVEPVGSPFYGVNNALHFHANCGNVACAEPNS